MAHENKYRNILAIGDIVSSSMMKYIMLQDQINEFYLKIVNSTDTVWNFVKWKNIFLTATLTQNSLFFF